VRGDEFRHGMRGGTRKKRGEGSLLVSFARGTRALRRMGRERPGALLARRTRTVKLCSFDARSKGQPGYSL
jgi:hypothetical protein